MKNAVIQNLVGGYLAARHSNAALTPAQAAGFLITQFGVLESVYSIESIGLHARSNYWNEIHKELKTAL